MRDLQSSDILKLVSLAEKIEKGKTKPNLSGKILAALFFEPSTRTQLSFETAMKNLGGEVISVVGTASTSITKGETLADTAIVIAQYANAIVMRHSAEGSARYIADLINIPVINAGDGSNQHPSQSLLDVYSISKTQGRLDNLKIGLVGDLKYGRTVHSLIYAMASFKPTFYFVAPNSLKMPPHFTSELKKMGVKFREHEFIEDVIKDLDILYVTRIQRERFPEIQEYDRVKNIYMITAKMLEKVKPNLKILHPLPRVNEINKDVDETPYAYYFTQAKNGVFMREAILATLLGGKK